MSPLGKKNMRVHFVFLFARAYIFFLYILIKKYPTCPTILPHADKPRQDAIYNKKFGRILLTVSYLFDFRCGSKNGVVTPFVGVGMR